MAIEYEEGQRVVALIRQPGGTWKKYPGIFCAKYYPRSNQGATYLVLCDDGRNRKCKAIALESGSEPQGNTHPEVV